MDLVLTAPATSDAAAVTEVVAALESSLYGPTVFSQADLEQEWTELDFGRDLCVVRDADRIVGYGAVRERGEVSEVEGYVHPDALGRGVGTLISTWLEDEAARAGARRVRNHVLEADSAAGRLLVPLGYRPVRVFREMRVELDAAPPAAAWPDGLRTAPFDPDRDAVAFHAAHQEAFSNHWGYTRRDFELWSRLNLRSARFDPALWCMVLAGDEVVAGTICTADTYGGGWVHTLFTRRDWRKRGVGAALLRDSFGRFWERGERNVGLGVDAEDDNGAVHLYERAGMSPVLGWLVYEKELGAPNASTRFG